jgi:ketosteroid isomerase-like protein
MLNGIDAVRKSNEEMKKSGWKVVDFKTKTHSVVSCGDMVTEIGTFDIAFSMEGQEKPMKDAGKYITIWEKQKDMSWKIKIETWNTDMNPWMEKKD